MPGERDRCNRDVLSTDRPRAVLPCASGIRVCSSSPRGVACAVARRGGFVIDLPGEQEGGPRCPLTVGIVRHARCRPPCDLGKGSRGEVGFGKRDLLGTWVCVLPVAEPPGPSQGLVGVTVLRGRLSSPSASGCQPPPNC